MRDIEKKGWKSIIATSFPGGQVCFPNLYALGLHLPAVPSHPGVDHLHGLLNLVSGRFHWSHRRLDHEPGDRVMATNVALDTTMVCPGLL